MCMPRSDFKHPQQCHGSVRMSCPVPSLCTWCCCLATGLDKRAVQLILGKRLVSAPGTCSCTRRPDFRRPGLSSAQLFTAGRTCGMRRKLQKRANYEHLCICVSNSCPRLAAINNASFCPNYKPFLLLFCDGGLLEHRGSCVDVCALHVGLSSKKGRCAGQQYAGKVL